MGARDDQVWVIQEEEKVWGCLSKRVTWRAGQKVESGCRCPAEWPGVQEGAAGAAERSPRGIPEELVNMGSTESTELMLQPREGEAQVRTTPAFIASEI